MIVDRRELPSLFYGPLMHRTKFELWNYHGREYPDADIWLAQYLARSKVSKSGKSAKLRAFTKVYLKIYKETNRIFDKLTNTERAHISNTLARNLKSWVTPGEGPFY